MKKIILPLLALAALTAGATSKFDARTRLAFACTPPASRAESSVKAFVRLADGASPDDIGLPVVRTFGRLVLVSATAAELMALENNSAVDYVSIERSVEPANDRSAAAVGSRKVAEGTADVPGYTGRGVLAGLFDTGFDVHNPAFRTADGATRIERIFHYTGYEGAPAEYDSETLSTFETDNVGDCHGSHVLGTMAGRYHGDIRMAVSPTESVTVDGSVLDGMATDADLAIACGPLTDANIADGVARIVDHARSSGKPCVVNLSLSDITGPHDGSDALPTALSELAKESVIVMSSGNYASHGKSITHIFSPEKPWIGTFLWPIWWTLDNTGYFAVWSADERPLELSINVTENSVDKVHCSYTIDPDTEGFVIVTNDYSGGEGRPEGTPDAGLSAGYTDSFVAVFTERSPSGRHCYLIAYELHKIESVNNHYFGLGIVARGEPGQRADMYLSSTWGELHSLNREGYVDGRDDMSVSSMACGEGLVCVGAWTGRASWPTLDGRTQYIDEEKPYAENTIARFSSYGELIDGRRLPHTVAPGASVMSLYSTPYKLAHPDNTFYGIYAETVSADRPAYWVPQYGTSMSAPVVSGCIAQWLEADPSLCGEDVLEIIKATSTVDEAVEACPERWGAGRFNAEAGLREVLRRKASLAGPSAIEPGEMQLSRKGSVIEVFIPGARGFDAALVGISGMTAAAAATDGDTATIDTSGLAPGVYVVRAADKARKIVLSSCR